MFPDCSVLFFCPPVNPPGPLVNTTEDIRFTEKSNTIYAIALDWPADNCFVCKRFGKEAFGEIKEVHSPHTDRPLKFEQWDDCLVVELDPDTPVKILPVIAVKK